MTGTIQQFDYSVDLLRAILWQYNNALRLQILLQNKQSWYINNQSQFWQNWYDDVFNLQTANDFGLSVWSIILGQTISTTVNFNPPTTSAFGFGSKRRNFTRGNFRSTTGGTYPMPNWLARIVLQLRYFRLIGTSAVPEINRALKFIFKDYGLAYVTDNHNMTMTYFFKFNLNPQLAYVLTNFDILPRPAGVKVGIGTIGTRKRFGFGVAHGNFNRSNFGS